MDPSAITVGVSALNRVVCIYSNFEQLVGFFVCFFFNIRERKQRELFANVTFSVRIHVKNHSEGFHLLIFINGQ